MKHDRQVIVERIGALIISEHGEKIERLFGLNSAIEQNQPSPLFAGMEIFDRMVLAGLAKDREDAIRLAAHRFKSCDSAANGRWNQLARWSLDLEISKSPIPFD